MVQATLISWLLQVQASEIALHVGPGDGRVRQVPSAAHLSAILNAHIMPLPQSASVEQVAPPASMTIVHAPV
jgi:hypothetical protein